MRLNKKVFLTIFCAFSAFAGWAQSEVYNYYKEKFPKESSVYLLDHTNYEVVLDEKGSVNIVMTRTDEKLILNELGTGWRDGYIYYDSFSDVEELKAYSFIPSGKKFKKKKVKEFRREKVMSDNVFHDDQKVVKFTFPDVKEGGKVRYEYVETIHNPRFFPPVYLQNSRETNSLKISLKTPNNVSVNVTGFHLEGIDFQYSEIKEKDFTYYEWVLDSVPKFEHESGTPSLNYYVPHLTFRIEKVIQESGETRILKSVDDLYGWYSSLMDSVDYALTPDLIQIVDSVKNASSSERQIAEGLFNWTRGQINYIAVEDGLGGFIPDDPQQVYTKKFGDCKGVSCLLATMLRHAGLEGRECWIGSRNKSYSYDNLCTPFTDDHMITAVKLEGNWLFLDPTDDHVPFGYPSSFIQGKQALIRGFGAESYTLQMVPVMTAYENRQEIVDTLHWDNQNLLGSAQNTLLGYLSSNFERRFQKVEESKREKYLQGYFETGHEKWKISEFDGPHFSNATTDLHFNYELQDWVKQMDDRLFIPLGLNRFRIGSVYDNRKTPLEINHKVQLKGTYYLEIPKGYTLGDLPKDFLLETEISTLTVKYRLQGSYILYEINFQLDTLLVQVDQIEQWNKSIKALRKQQNKNIELIKNP